MVLMSAVVLAAARATARYERATLRHRFAADLGLVDCFACRWGNSSSRGPPVRVRFRGPTARTRS